ncbi:hypothetical protein [Dactylosporangium salmoneum]|uniref:Tetratricopeptide repeat protein n=1 Tax=Dactylosporangium salmoneum TaxID=53361 RepID=A0ABN3HV78_9ACTN
MPAAAERCRLLVLQAQRAFGPRHPATARPRRSLARWLGMSRAVPDAVAVLDELHRDLLAALGPDDPQTAAVSRDLSYWSQHALR